MYMKKREGKKRNKISLPITRSQWIKVNMNKVFINCDYGNTVLRTTVIPLTHQEWKTLNEKVADLKKMVGLNHLMSKNGIALPISTRLWIKVSEERVSLNSIYGKQ